MMGAETIARALDSKAYLSRGYWRAPCPVHGSKGATLALRDTGSGLSARCFAGCGRGAVLAELRRRGLFDGVADKPDPEADARQLDADARDRAKRIAAARWIWEQETEPAGPLIETYLGGRIILCPIPPTVRLHRSLYHREANCRRPAMVCAVEHVEHGFVALHCTYLAANGEGKATAIEPVKRFIGPVGGGAVRLAPATDTVAVVRGHRNRLVLSGSDRHPDLGRVVGRRHPLPYCSFQATFLLRGAGLAPRDRNDDGGVGWLTRLCRRAALTIRLCLMPRRRFFPRSPR